MLSVLFEISLQLLKLKKLSKILSLGFLLKHSLIRGFEGKTKIKKQVLYNYYNFPGKP